MDKRILTNPKEHNPNNFVYLVHSLLDWNCSGIKPQEMKDKLNRIKDPNQFYRASLIGCLDKESAKQRIGFYGGEVYQIGTFGDIGMIVNPAHDGLIYVAWNGGIGSPWDLNKLKTYALQHKGKVRTPLILLTQTRGHDTCKYNELIIKGDEKTDIQGVFYKDRDSETEKEGKLLAEIVSEIMKKEIPIIKLPQPAIQNYDEIKDPEERELRKIVENLKGRIEINQVNLSFHSPKPILF